MIGVTYWKCHTLIKCYYSVAANQAHVVKHSKADQLQELMLVSDPQHCCRSNSDIFCPTAVNAWQWLWRLDLSTPTMANGFMILNTDFYSISSFNKQHRTALLMLIAMREYLRRLYMQHTEAGNHATHPQASQRRGQGYKLTDLLTDKLHRITQTVDYTPSSINM